MLSNLEIAFGKGARAELIIQYWTKKNDISTHPPTSSAAVKVEPYNPLWPTHFLAIKATLTTYLHALPILSIEHVGSTSVPNLAAKPIIDIDIIVTRSNLQPTIDRLVSNNFTHLGDLGITDRHALRDPDQVPPRNIYVCLEGCVQLRNHLGVREVLRRDPGLRDEYARVKMGLAERGMNIFEYVEAKSGILQKILKEAGVLSDDELGSVQAANRKGERFGVIKTEREGLVLREFVLADEEDFSRLESLEEVVRYQTFGPRTREEARALMAEIVRNSSVVPRTHVELVAEFEGKFIGRVGAKISSLGTTGTALDAGEGTRSMPHADLWFSFLPLYQGKGLATEAMRTFILLLKAPVELEIECDPRNTGSMKMAERLNFEKISEEEDVFECKGVLVGSAVFRKVVESR